MLELTPQRYKNRIAIGERPDMLIDEEFRKCVTFLFVDKPDQESGNLKRVPAATAFLVGPDTDDPVGHGSIPRPRC